MIKIWLLKKLKTLTVDHFCPAIVAHLLDHLWIQLYGSDPTAYCFPPHFAFNHPLPQSSRRASFAVTFFGICPTWMLLTFNFQITFSNHWLARCTNETFYLLYLLFGFEPQKCWCQKLCTAAHAVGPLRSLRSVTSAAPFTLETAQQYWKPHIA